jgi:hypothetical protein
MSAYRRTLVRRLVMLSLSPLFMGSLGFAEEHSEQSPNVKKSNARTCYERGAGIYDELKIFTPFKTIEECVKSGGRARFPQPKIDQTPGIPQEESEKGIPTL